MERFIKVIVLLMIAMVPAAAPRNFVAAPPALCFNAGPTTFALSPTATAPDVRVKFIPVELQPDVRLQLVQDVASADFAFVDDVASMPGSPCRSAGPIRTVRIVGEATPADVSVSLSGQPGDHKLFVHSARFGHQDAAALFAAVLHFQGAQKIGERE